MDINRALYKISTAYNDLENIHLFKKYKTAQENPEFPTIRTRAEFPDYFLPSITGKQIKQSFRIFRASDRKI
jgi:hypothetical protein